LTTAATVPRYRHEDFFVGHCPAPRRSRPTAHAPPPAHHHRSPSVIVRNVAHRPELRSALFSAIALTRARIAFEGAHADAARRLHRWA
jgi:hypothetical protein